MAHMKSGSALQRQDLVDDSRTNFLAASLIFSMKVAGSFWPAALAALMFCSRSSSKVLSISLLPENETLASVLST